MISWRSLLAALSMNFSFIYNNNNNNNNNKKKKKKKKKKKNVQGIWHRLL
jgi:hypothetical protein